jgi:Winged helix-turn helix
VELRADFSASCERLEADGRCRSRRSSTDGMNRAAAAQIGGMGRQTLGDWVHRFNKAGPDGLRDAWASGPTPRLSAGQKARLVDIIEPTGKWTASCDGGASVSSASSPRLSEPTITSAMSERF